ncbi:MAG TPA: S-layer homology domain-containing protein [Anaerolineales bacterium]|nr:S-layer homology domain-containing protein [Anaerolineales bacterium]
MTKRNRMFLSIASSLMLLAVALGLWGRLGPMSTQVTQALSSNVQHVETDEKEADHPEEAREYRALAWRDENGNIPADGLFTAAQQINEMRAQQGNNPQAITSAGWTWIGPGNIGGRVRSIIIHPTDTNIMWAGSVTGGIWKSTDGGASWNILTDFMSNMAVTTMVIDPSNPNILYAGTGEGFTGNREISEPLGGGVFKTTDGGSTWTQLSSTNNSNWYFVNRLAIHPSNPQILLAATYTGLWRSTDGGSSWSSVLTGYMADVNFNPSDGNKAVAGNQFSGQAYYSTNGGVSWGSTNTGGNGRVEVAYAPSSPSTVYASVDNIGGQLWKSVDGGVSYALVNSGNDFLSGQGWYDNALWVDPTNPNTLVVGGVDLYRSTNGGSTLTQISEWWNSPQSAHADHHVIVEKPGFNGTSNTTVYFGNDGGVYRANNVYTVVGTTGWTELNNNLGITQFYGAAGNATTGKIIGCKQNATTQIYTPAGGTEGWTTTFGGDGGWSAADPTDDNYLYGEYIYAQIHRSVNGGVYSDPIWGEYWDGSSYQYKNPPYIITDTYNSNANFISPFILDPNDSNRMLVGAASLWRSNDVKAPNTTTTGPSWYVIKSSTGYNITAIAVAPGNSDIVWVGHENGDVFKTTNGTATNPTWTRADTGSPALPNRYVTRITIDKNDNNKAYVTFGGFSTDNVWATTNGGSTWADITGSGATGLPSLPVRSLVIHPNDSNWLYIGTELGLFASSDGGATWGLPHDGPTNTPVDELFWMGTKLVAATYGRGLFTQEASNTLFADVPADYWALSFIERLYNAGITGGCGTNPLIYCPEAPVTRAQMAIFILRGIHGSAYVPPAATGTVFTDVPAGSFAADWIEQLAAEGITGGCGNGSYCPDAYITRAQMAIFLLRGEHGSAYTPPAATGTVFGDVPVGAFAADWIEQLAAEGVTSGCGGGNYCPDANVTRAEMAVFLVRTFSLP